VKLVSRKKNIAKKSNNTVSLNKNHNLKISKQEAEPVVKELKQLVSAVFKGPIPPPAMLKQYNTIDPTFSNRILKMAEKEQSFRHKIENKIVDKQFTERRIGQLFGLIIGIVAIAGGSITAILGNPWAGGLIGGGGVAGLVAVFVYGKRSKDINDKKESEDNH
jgi:uncharacterized membrane protein